jgi:hypothetical protein
MDTLNKGDDDDDDDNNNNNNNNNNCSSNNQLFGNSALYVIKRSKPECIRKGYLLVVS